MRCNDTRMPKLAVQNNSKEDHCNGPIHNTREEIQKTFTAITSFQRAQLRVIVGSEFKTHN